MMGIGHELEGRGVVGYDKGWVPSVQARRKTFRQWNTGRKSARSRLREEDKSTSDSKWFYVREEGNGVIVEATCDGAGMMSARSSRRELTLSGRGDEA